MESITCGILEHVSKFSGLIFFCARGNLQKLPCTRMMFSEINIYNGTSSESFCNGRVVSRSFSDLSVWGSGGHYIAKNNNFIRPGKSYDNMVTKFKHIRRLIFLSHYVHYALKRNIPKSGSPLHAKVPQFIKNNKKNNICNGSCHSIGQMAQVNKGGIEIYLKTMIIITAYSHMAYSDCQWNMFDKKIWQIVMASKYGQTYQMHLTGTVMVKLFSQYTVSNGTCIDNGISWGLNT